MPKTAKAAKNIKVNAKGTSASAPRARWLTTTVCTVVGILLLVALLDYIPQQSTRVAIGTGVAGNVVGQFGAAWGYWGLRILGFAAWAVPLALLVIAYQGVYKFGVHFRTSRCLVWVPALIALSGLCAMLQSGWLADDWQRHLGDIRFRENPTNPFYTTSAGAGGLVGSALYQEIMRYALGPFGSALLYLAVLLSALGYACITNVRGAWAGLKAGSLWAVQALNWALQNMLRAVGLGSIAAMGAVKRGVAAAANRPAPTESGFEEAPLPPTKTTRAKAKAKINVHTASAADDADWDADENDEAPLPPTPAKAIKREPIKPPGAEKAAGTQSGLKIISGEALEKSNAAENTPTKKGDYEFPPLNLLSEPPVAVSMGEDYYQETADALVRTLGEFKVDVHLGEIHSGPVITRYEVTPAAGVRVEKIAALDKNIALGLKAEAVRILAPVPGKGTVGVEVPNKHSSPVSLKEIISSRAWGEANADIPIVLGKDVTGKPVVIDLTKMPHMLIAGSTGAGKTVCINSIIASLLYKLSPDELRFIMVDPKVVEMQGYNALPHMLIPVVTEPKKVPGALKWLIAEMERRYQIFAKTGARNIAGFNAKVAKNRADKAAEEAREAELNASLSPEERAGISNMEVPRDEGIGEDFTLPEKKLPYIVCIIDELADLMMVAPADIETAIARLAQLARAAGIHLILATQRPSVNVITGIIKANLPTRIAFKVASNTDSRTILDAKGAEALIGKGDMLFTPPGSSNIVRAQGAFVSDEEIETIVEYLTRNGPPIFSEEIQRQVDAEGEDGDTTPTEGTGEWEDELVPEAWEVILNSKRASTSMLQRRLKIGYNRAARIMEMLEEAGYVGPENGSSPREILKETE